MAPRLSLSALKSGGGGGVAVVAWLTPAAGGGVDVGVVAGAAGPAGGGMTPPPVPPSAPPLFPDPGSKAPMPLGVPTPVGPSYPLPARQIAAEAQLSAASSPAVQPLLPDGASNGFVHSPLDPWVTSCSAAGAFS